MNPASMDQALDSASLSLRFFHLSKLPGAWRRGIEPEAFEDVDAFMAGVTADQSRLMRQAFSREAAAAAETLAARSTVRAALADLSFEPGAVIVALGDSITDDALSWANLLSLLLATRRPALDLVVVNAGITGNTTQEAISRFDTIAALRPRLIIQMLGTNDARRHGSAQIRTTSPEETRRNLEALRTLTATETEARLLTLTPPPVLGHRADGWVPFQAEKITWRDSDIADIAGIVRAADPEALDVHRMLTEAGVEDRLLADGVHPNLAGQALITELVVTRLGQGAELPYR